ncbi:YrhK family protein [Salinicola halophilus]|uniref:YrhK family protein n=1 Tax=Salinicola halophilus TaxID=184065 RepID=UPI000DA2688E|nr:YrhK family protein [Salinicola halophilus]
MNDANRDRQSRSKTLEFGDEELIIRQRYETLSIVNDVLIGIWFVVGSVLFFFEPLVYYGTWLFVIGSVEMLIRPVIRLIRRIHLKRLKGGSGSSVETSHDF